VATVGKKPKREDYGNKEETEDKQKMEMMIEG
jgi:hypothetical protein